MLLLLPFPHPRHLCPRLVLTASVASHSLSRMSWTILCAPFADTTCADMCVSDPSLWVPNWMSAMANYPPPPPPPLPDHQQYNSLYPASVGAHHKVESGQQPPLQYTSLNTPSYPKIESVTPAQRHNAQLQDLAQELSQHAALEDSQCHETQQTSQPLQQQGLPHVQPTAHAGAPQIPEQLSAQEIARSNRLRKACDSCSVRKVKVCLSHDLLWRSIEARVGGLS